MKVCCGRWVALVVLGGLTLAAPRADAQQDGFGSGTFQPQSQQVDDLLRQLIETELQQRRDYLAPDQRALPTALPRATSPTREMLEARRILNEVSRDADTLATQLNEDMRRVPAVRTYLGDVLKLRARANILAQRSQTMNDHNLLVDELRNIDREWRLLATQLQQTYGLDRRTLTTIASINDKAKLLGDSLELKPQMDRRELLHKTATLSADFNNLLQDIEIELARSNDRNQLLLDGRRLQQQVSMVALTIEDNNEYNGVLNEYKRFQDLWYAYAARLRPYQNRYLERDVNRISQTDSEIHQLLWLPQRVDKQRLLYLTDVLKRNVDEFFVRTPLKLLIELPNTAAVLPTAHEFYGTCAHFADCVNDGDDHEELIAAFRYIEASHQTFASTFRPLNSTAALQVLAQIDEGVNSLRNSLGTQNGNGYDNRRAVELAASIDILAEHIDGDIKRWLNRYREPYGPQALQESAAFAAAARRFHENLVGRAIPNQSQLQRDANQLFESWRRVYGHIARCNTDDKSHLQAMSVRITPAIVELQTLLVAYRP